MIRQKRAGRCGAGLRGSAPLIWLFIFCSFGFLSVSTVVAQTPPAKSAAPAKVQPQPITIDRASVLILTRSAILALDQANKTGNYSVFREWSAPAFALTNSSGQLADIFAQLRRNRTDLSGVLILEPQLTKNPEIDARGNLHLVGYFPSTPTQLRFELIYAPVDQQWRLYDINLDINSSGAISPPVVNNKQSFSASKSNKD